MTSKPHGRLPGLNHRLILELDRGRVREMLLAVALSAMLLLPLLLYVWQSSEWLRNGYRIEQLKNRRDHMVEVNHQLRLEKASLENLARVEQLAGDQLGLSEPPGGTVVLVDMNRLRPVRQTSPGRVASNRTITPQRSPEPDASNARTAN
jgi:cell division protein FtsL